ncbi:MULTISPECIES: WD40 repeat domain-containing protein [unclassified Streptomyces]|uniref:WD40 repeat domain-containing protein n=1 Tax=unclassified Streptomyces TaxID=2593676 RepID=UPI0035E3693B
MFPAPHGGTSEAVEALALSPDGRTLAVGGAAGTLQLWDTATQRPLGGPLTTSGEAIDSVAFSPDGATLYAGSAHVPLQRYTVAPERVVAQVCARAGTELTRAQWRASIPDLPYRRVCRSVAPTSRGDRSGALEPPHLSTPYVLRGGGSKRYAAGPCG